MRRWSPSLRSSVVPCKESVLAIQGNRPDGSLDGIVVNLDMTVSQEDVEAVPVFCEIGARVAERRLASNADAMMAEPGSHVFDQRS